MYLNKQGLEYLDAIALTLEKKIGFKVINESGNMKINRLLDNVACLTKTQGKRLKKAADVGNTSNLMSLDPIQGGSPDIRILFSLMLPDTYLWPTDNKTLSPITLLRLDLNEMTSCGMLSVSDLSVLDKSYYNSGKLDELCKKYKPFTMQALLRVIDIFNTNMESTMGGLSGMYKDRYGMAKSLMFNGEKIGAKKYKDIGFKLRGNYNNTRYPAKSRGIYVLDSRKDIDEGSEENTHQGCEKFKPEKNDKLIRREDSFDIELTKTLKELSKDKPKPKSHVRGGEFNPFD